MVLTQIGPVWVLLACLHDALATWMRALVLDCNGSGDIGIVSLCHLLATHVIKCVWPAAVHPRTGALVLLRPRRAVRRRPVLGQREAQFPKEKIT